MEMSRNDKNRWHRSIQVIPSVSIGFYPGPPFWGFCNRKQHCPKIKKPSPSFERLGSFKKSRRRPTLPHKKCEVPSALEGLTSVFGMGTGVSPPLKSPGNNNLNYCLSQYWILIQRECGFQNISLEHIPLS